MINFATELVVEAIILSIFGVKNIEKAHFLWLDGYFLLFLPRNFPRRVCSITLRIKIEALCLSDYCKA